MNHSIKPNKYVYTYIPCKEEFIFVLLGFEDVDIDELELHLLLVQTSKYFSCVYRYADSIELDPHDFLLKE